jgi:RNA polymerase sigma-70 factor (ECF subfamily)
MGFTDHVDRRQRSGSPSTLGDIVFGAPGSAPSETEWVALVRSIAARDDRALHALYERTHRIVFTLLMRITRNRQTAEELTVDVYHEVWRRAPDYEPAYGSVIGWVMNLTRSRGIDRVRFERRRKRVDANPDGTAAIATITGPHEVLESEEQGRRVRSAVALLTPLERDAIETAFFSGLTHAEVAEQLGEPLGTIKTRIRSGLSKLRQALRGEVRR